MLVTLDVLYCYAERMCCQGNKFYILLQNVCKTYIYIALQKVLYKPVCTGIQVTACGCAVQLKQPWWVRQSTLAQQTSTNSLKLPHMYVLCSLIQTCIINTSSLILYTLFLCCCCMYDCFVILPTLVLRL